MKIIILDTNFLVHCLDWKIRFEEEVQRIVDETYTLAVLDKTIQELKTLKGQPAKIALHLTERYKVLKTESHGYTDDDILQFDDTNHILATQDKELKKRWQGQIITIRKKSYLELT